jgi:hypothetical protein
MPPGTTTDNSVLPPGTTTDNSVPEMDCAAWFSGVFLLHISFLLPLMRVPYRHFLFLLFLLIDSLQFVFATDL